MLVRLRFIVLIAYRRRPSTSTPFFKNQVLDYQPLTELWPQNENLLFRQVSLVFVNATWYPTLACAGRACGFRFCEYWGLEYPKPCGFLFAQHCVAYLQVSHSTEYCQQQCVCCNILDISGLLLRCVVWFTIRRFSMAWHRLLAFGLVIFGAPWLTVPLVAAVLILPTLAHKSKCLRLFVPIIYQAFLTR